ncbi:unnamed protein product [Plutella xylostella]|uniref:(diamondback moth) hypothetical protein n=1 Tax=Plutella xylostella TaxID=51655 RepID=A0A8S4FNV2_PLUXY|nr:unnamed protein product [Plutella xylostella]
MVTICGSDIRVLRKMDVRCSIFKLLLFQMFVTWCGGMSIDNVNVQYPADVEEDIQNSIRQLVHNGIYSHKHLDPSRAQVAYPVKVTSRGALISREVAHEHAHGHARARRDLHAREHELDHVVHYNLTVDGRELRLDLR